LLEAFEHDITEIGLVPSSGGAFEVEVDGRLVYSKKATGKHAEYSEVVDAVGELVDKL
jgi:selenoprotein W-related protein